MHALDAEGVNGLFMCGNSVGRIEPKENFAAGRREFAFIIIEIEARPRPSYSEHEF